MSFHAAVMVSALFLGCAAEMENPPSEEAELCEVYAEGELRLAGASPDAGRVEIRHNDEWGTLCGAPSINLSRVLCRELGFGRAIGVFSIAPKSPTRNWFSGIACRGDEARIADCAHSTWGGGPGCSDAAPPIAVRCEAAGLETGEAIPISELNLPGVDPSTVLEPYTARADPQSCAQDNLPVDPFKPNVTGAYVHKHLVEPFLELRSQRLRDEMCANAGRQDDMRSLVDDGLKWGPFGFDFSGVGSGQSLLSERRAATVRDAYLSPNAKVFWSLDREPRRPEALPPMSPAAQSIFRNLSRDGFVRIDDFGLDMDALQASADWALSQRKLKNVTVVLDDGACIMARPKLPALDALLNNETINSAIKGYLGADTVLHGYKVLRLSKKMQGADNYIAADWHHDRAGRRLKMFVFLHDVDEEIGRPTQVTNGTHNLVYYAFETYATSRYDHGFIADNFEIHKLGGKRGGGFIFDTNAIHRGSPVGYLKRETVILEYHNAYKCPAIHALKMNVPCPSGDQFMVNHKL